MSAGMICGAGLFTGIFWFIVGATKTVNIVTKFASKPIIRGIVLGLGLLFVTEGIGMMLVSPWLGVILFFAGAELAISTRDIGSRKEDFYVMLVVAGFAMWNMGAAFLAGVILHQALERGWVKI